MELHKSYEHRDI